MAAKDRSKFGFYQGTFAINGAESPDGRVDLMIEFEMRDRATGKILQACAAACGVAWDLEWDKGEDGVLLPPSDRPPQ